MNYLDIIIALPLIWGAFIGFKKGFIIEMTTLIGIGLGMYGSATFSNSLTHWLSNSVDWSPWLIKILAFLIIFLIIVTVVQLIGRGIEKLIKLGALGLMNRIAGSCFGLMKYALLVALLIYLTEKVDSRYKILDDKWKTEAFLYNSLAGIIPALYPKLEHLSIENIHVRIAPIPGNT